MTRHHLPLRTDSRPQVRVTALESSCAIAVVVAGDVDQHTVDTFAGAAQAAVAHLAGRLLIVDFSGLRRLGTAGLTPLISLHRSLGHRLRLVVPEDAPAKRPLRLSGLDRILGLYETVEQASHA